MMIGLTGLISSGGVAYTPHLIESILSKEGYASAHMHCRSPSLRKILLALIKRGNQERKI